MVALSYIGLNNRLKVFVFSFISLILYCHSQLLLSQPPNRATPDRNYVIHLFYPCKSNQWAVEQSACIWLRVALGSTVMRLTIIQTGQALLTWEAKRFILIWGLGWSGLPKGWSYKTSVVVQTVLTFLCLGICRTLMRSSVIDLINAVFDVNAGVIVRDDNILFLNCTFISRSS